MGTENEDSTNISIEDLAGGYSTDLVEGPNEDEKKEIFGDSLKNEPVKKKRGRPPKNPMAESMTLSGDILTGALFLSLVDLVVPLVLKIGYDKIKGTSIDQKGLKLSKAQKDELSPIADEVIKQLSLSTNPTALLIISLLGIYGLNLVSSE